MSITNKDIAGRARQMAAKSDGLARRSALCVGVAAGTTRTVGSARKALEVIDMRDLKAAAIALLDKLAEDGDAGPLS